MSEHRWSELVAPYALGALDDAERQEFEIHLDECANCRQELSEMNEVSRMLAHGAGGPPPPDRLRDRILADARRSKAADSDISARVEASRAPLRVERGKGNLRSAVGPARLIPWLAAAAAVTFAVVSSLTLRKERNARVELQTAFDAARAALAGRDSLLASLLSPELRVASLAEPAGPSPLRLFWDPTRRVVVVMASNLRPAPSGRDYQLWGIVPGNDPVSLGVFNTDSSGQLVRVLQMPEGYLPSIGAITEEPAGGSVRATTAPILVGEWRRME